MKIDSDFNDIDALGDDHIGSSSETPMRAGAFLQSNSEKIDSIKRIGFIIVFFITLNV